MGCDVHLLVERPAADGWELVDPDPCSCYCGSASGCHICLDGDNPYFIGVPGMCRSEWYTARNSILFAALDGGRLRGCFAPIAAGRGLPADLGGASLEIVRRWLADGGEIEWPSWLTIAEIEGWPGWDTVVRDDRPRLVGEVIEAEPHVATLRSMCAGFLDAVAAIKAQESPKARITFFFEC